MPEYLKTALMAKLTACLGDSNKLVSRDSRDHEPFSCVHFSWYNRYTTNVSDLIYSLISISELMFDNKGDGAPHDKHPHQLKRANASRANISQYLPYMSNDFEKHPTLHEDIGAVFKDVFIWMEAVVGFLPFDCLGIH